MISRLRHRLGLRLAAVLAVSLAATGFAQYLFVTDQLERDLVRNLTEVHRADARAIERAAAEAGENESQLAEVTEMLEAIQARPTVNEAVVADASGQVAAAGDNDELATYEDEPQVLEAVRSGRSFEAVESYRDNGEIDEGHYSYITPVTIGGRQYAFEVEQTTGSVQAQIAGVRAATILFLLISVGLAVVTFYLFGGRSVDRLYRLALDRARRDGLTDLGNLRAFEEELATAVAAAHRHGRSLALAVIDVDDFKFLNDSLGHRRGDEVLVALAGVLADGRASDRAFRLGGDEFAVLLDACDEDQARAALERLASVAAERLDGVTISLGLRAGVSGGHSAEDLWEEADRALYEAKRRGGGTVVAHSELVGDEADTVPIGKVRAVRALIAGADLDVAFQPIWDMESGAVLSYEALARPRELHGLDGPGEAFDVAERIGRAHELDTVCRAAALAAAHRLPADALLFLNVSPQSLDHDVLAGDALLRQVRAAGLTPDRVVLEITERSAARLPRVVAEMQRLASLGFRLALDDVGAGNAGLEILRVAHVDFVKIDRSVVQAAPEDRKALAVLQGILAFARGVGAYVIAEGIEVEGQLSFVRDGVGSTAEIAPIKGAQGFLLGRPAPLPEAVAAPAA